MFSPSEGPCCWQSCDFVSDDDHLSCLVDMECSNASFCKYPFGVLLLIRFLCPVLDLQLMVTTYVGKLSAVGQPTRPTQPFILLG